MADLIDRQAAIEKIHWLGLDNDTAIMCDLAIRALPPVHVEPMRWIPVSERQPEEYGIYLACNKRGVILITRYGIYEEKGVKAIGWGDEDLGEWPTFYHHSPRNKIIAWMPLPKAFSESEGQA